MGRAYQNRKESMAKTSDAKAKVYSKYGREIYVVAKNGGTDPNGNLSLRRIIDNAKKDKCLHMLLKKPLRKQKAEQEKTSYPHAMKDLVQAALMSLLIA